MSGRGRPATPEAAADERSLITRVRERSVLHAYRAATWALGHAPEAPAQEVGGILAQGTYLAWPARRRASRASFARVLGTDPSDPRVDRLARRMYRNYARYIVDIMRLPSRPPHWVAERADLSAAEILQEVYDRGQGMIIAAAHVGHSEAGAAAVADRGWPVTVLADDTEYKELFALLQEQRGRWGVRLIPWTSVREIFGVLKRREIVGLLVDWGYKPDGVPVRWFGEWTTFPAGPAVLAAKTGAVIAPMAVRLTREGGYAGYVGEVIEVASTEPAEVARATQAVADALEVAIRRTPDQWWVFKSMWPETDEDRARLLARLPEYGLDAGDG